METQKDIQQKMQPMEMESDSLVSVSVSENADIQPDKTPEQESTTNVPVESAFSDLPSEIKQVEDYSLSVDSELQAGLKSIDADDKALQKAIQLFTVRRELNSLTNRQGWRGSVIRQILERGRREISNIPLVGDALFFRTAAFMDDDHEQSVKDFKRLIRQRSWVEKEQRAGGGMLIFVGDSLLNMGQADDAVHAYELAMVSPQAEVKERLAVATVYAEILRREDSNAISRAADRATDLAPDTHLPQLLAALGLLISGDGDAAMSRIDIAEKLGASETACRCLRSICTSEFGTMTVVRQKC